MLAFGRTGLAEVEIEASSPPAPMLAFEIDARSEGGHSSRADVLPAPILELARRRQNLLPLLAPRAWRDAFRRLTEFSDGQLRFVGLLCVGIGALLLAVIYA